MKATYQTLDEYLDALDKIKESVAEDTQGMDAKQVAAFFARAHQKLEQCTGMKVRVRKAGRKRRTNKRS